MALKTVWNFLKSKFFWINIAIAVICILLICTLVLGWLKIYTHHGESVEVPDLTGLYVEEAELFLKERNLKYEVIDSVHLRSLRPGEIAEQSPAKGSFVKKNRKIYLTVNAKGVKKVIFRDYRGESFRKAQSNYRNSGFIVDSIEYKPSQYPDEVLEVKYNDKTLFSGEMIPEGANLILVVGKVEEGVEVIVPVIKGLSYDEAMAIIDANSLMPGNISFDKEPKNDEDKAKYMVYHQDPAAGVTVEAGKRINIWFSKNKNKKHIDKSHKEEEFF